MSTELNKKLAAQWFTDVFSTGNLALIDQLVAPDYVNYDPYVPGGAWRGLDGARALITTYRGAFPDVTFTIEDQIAEGDKVVTRWSARGTHNGSLNGIPPTGKTALVTGINTKRIVNGKAIEEWANFDMFGMLRQLGIIPE